MIVTKKFDLGMWVTFDGTDKAIITLVAIHGEISAKGYGIVLPEEGASAEFSMPGVGRVKVTRVSFLKCTVELLQGALMSKLAHIFAQA